jgi:hypothetical protein
MDGFCCSKCHWEQRFDEPKPIAGGGESAATWENTAICSN